MSAPAGQREDGRRACPIDAAHAVLLGVVIGGLGSLFRWATESGFALAVASVHAGGEGRLPGWLTGALIGIVCVVVATAMTRRFAPEAKGSGIQEIEGTLKGLRPPLLWRRIIPVKLIGGTLAMTAGLVLGREGPTIHIGGAAGAAIAETAGCDDDQRNALIAAGAGAGLAVAFNAPLGGILFVVEELRDKYPLTRPALRSAIVATVAAVLVSWLIIGADRVLPIVTHERAAVADWAIVLPFAVIVGLYGVFFNWAVIASLGAMRALLARVPWPCVATAIGGGVGMVMWFFVDGVGGGEGLVPRLLAETPGVTSLLVLLAVRCVVFNVSFASGVPGGLFAPQLAFGTLLALLFSAAASHIVPDVVADPGRLAVVGMAALIAATVRAPLTGVALVIEMTGDFALLPFALAAAAIAAFTARLSGARPIYDELLERMLRNEAAPAADPRVDREAGGGEAR